MPQDFKQCPNGHYYQGDHCPYCKSSGSSSNNPTMKTELYANQGETPTQANETYVYPNSSGTKTTIRESALEPNPNETFIDDVIRNTPQNKASLPSSSRTVFGDENEFESVSTPTGTKVQRVFRESRKLVGWLVSYTIEPLGVDFKLYEGRNIIGRDIDCGITVNDNMVSAKHAVLLFRAGKFSITDTQSSHGTFVNDTDIELEPYYLQDGDVIKMGQTIFKFRSAF